MTDAVALQRQAESWCRDQRLTPADSDARRVHLLVIDDQVDFTFPGGALFVAGRSGRGGMEAQARLTRFIYRHLDLVTRITCTLDSHLPWQVFFPAALQDATGQHPPPHTVVTAAAVRAGELRPHPALARQLGATPEWLQRQAEWYCAQLEASGRHQLYLWPYHCLLGSAGHRLAGVVEEARLFHAFARAAENRLELKGMCPLTEHYSVFAPEVDRCHDGRVLPGMVRHQALLDELLAADAVLVAGLASSHCVAASVADLLAAAQQRDPELAKRIYVLTDCTAAVVVPGGLDFTAAADEAFAAFAAAGVRLVESTTPPAAWPGWPA